MHSKSSLILSSKILPWLAEHFINLLVHHIEYHNHVLCVEFVDENPQCIAFTLLNRFYGLLQLNVLVEELKLLGKLRKDSFKISEIRNYLF